jgi:hypothetical protein
MNELRAFVFVPLASEKAFDQIHSEERDRLNVCLFLRGVNLVRPGFLPGERHGTVSGLPEWSGRGAGPAQGRRISWQKGLALEWRPSLGRLW